MALTIKEIEEVALLARLNLDDKEKELFLGQLNSILDYVDVLNQLPTVDVEPLIHILPTENVFRQDIKRPSVSREEILANAPLVEEGQYKVPKII